MELIRIRTTGLPGSYLISYLDNEDEPYIPHDQSEKSLMSEIYRRIQMCYRFGLGTRTNIEKADQYLRKAQELERQ